MSFTLAASRPVAAPRALTDIAAGLAAALSGDELVLEPGEPRAFVPLLETPGYEAWLIAWGPAGSLDLHDHGGSEGAIHIVRGELVETYTDRLDRHPLVTRHRRAGDDVTIPARRVHEVWNQGPEVAVSLHVYAPRVTSMTFYDSDPARFLAPVRTVLTTAPNLDEIEVRP